jgi:hypothetical protein
MAGETSTVSTLDAPYSGVDGVFLVPFTTAFSSTQNETDDVMQIGYLPANVTVYGFIYAPTDMDSNVSPGLVHKITLGSTDLVTGLTGAQTGAKSFQPCVPTTITAKTLLKVQSTTAAATGAAGTLYLAAVCQR